VTQSEGIRRARDSRHRARGGDGAAGGDDILRERSGHESEVDDAGRGRVERGEPADVWLELPELVRPQPAEPRDLVRVAAPLELVEARQLGLTDGDDRLAAATGRDPARAAEVVELARAGDAEPRLQRARFVVDAGMDDAAVASGLVQTDLRFALEHRHPLTRIPAKRLPRGRQPDHTGADDREIALAAGVGRRAHRRRL
jgi:hypothetical protein